MAKKHKPHRASRPRAAAPQIEIDVIEEITTCDCSHALSQHTTEGCSITDCECDRERGLFLVGKIRAVDEL